MQHNYPQNNYQPQSREEKPVKPIEKSLEYLAWDIKKIAQSLEKIVILMERGVMGPGSNQAPF